LNPCKLYRPEPFESVQNYGIQGDGDNRYQEAGVDLAILAAAGNRASNDHPYPRLDSTDRPSGPDGVHTLSECYSSCLYAIVEFK
jgi:hypothetical protein